MRKFALVFGLSLAGLVVASGPLSHTTRAANDPDPDAVKQLALDYLKNGGQAGAGSAAAERTLADLGVNLAVGVTELGLTAIGVPGASAALGALKGLFYSEASPAQIAAVVNQRLDALERDVRTLSDNVAAIGQNQAIGNNNLRLVVLDQNVGEIRREARELMRVGEMSAIEKDNFVKNVLDLADKFLPKSGVRDNIWYWDNLRVIGDREKGVVIVRPEQASELNFALEPYLQSVALLASAIEVTGVTVDKASIDQHVFLLTGEGPGAIPGLGERSLRDRRWPVTCSTAGARNSTKIQSCFVHVSCTNTLVTKTRNIELPVPQGSFCTYNASLADGEIADLTDEVQSAPNPVADLVTAAAAKLRAAGTVENSRFNTRPSSEAFAPNYLYAVDTSGRLSRFQHVIGHYTATRDDILTNSLRCRTTVVPPQTHDTARDILTNSQRITPPAHQPAATRDDLLTNRQRITMPGGQKIGGQNDDCPPLNNGSPLSHWLSPAKAELGNWGGFTSVVPSQWFDSYLAVYGLKPDGDLMSRRLFIVRSKLTTPGEPLQEQPNRVGNGWNGLSQVFSTGEGVIYGVAGNGDLIWYRHLNNAFNPYGNVSPNWKSNPVGTGWGGFERLFSPGLGVIYAVRPDGALLWYKHRHYLTGESHKRLGKSRLVSAPWRGPNQVGTGWAGARHVFAGPDGQIYLVNAGGDLMFYKHKGWQTGTPDWEPPVKLASGWGNYAYVFAAMGSASEGSASEGPIVK